MRRTASITTLKDLKSYFSTPPWKGLGWVNGRFEGSRGLTDVKIWPSSALYTLQVHAVDDPSDSEELSTEEPLKDLAEFLGRDIPGGEHFDRMSSDPDAFAEMLETLASVVKKGFFDRLRTSAFIRRLASIPCTALAADDDGDPDSELGKLERDMKKKGWTVRKREEGGLPALEVDVHGIYAATITLESILYDYSFSYRGSDSADRSGTTDDPIRELRGWNRSPEVAELRREQEVVVQQRRDDRTIPVQVSP